mgnify:CR=1 FL=1
MYRSLIIIAKNKSKRIMEPSVMRLFLGWFAVWEN